MKSRLIEMRQLDAESRDAILARIRAGGHVEQTPCPVMTAWQFSSLPDAQRRQISDRAVIVVPDFLNYARLLNTGQAAAMLRLAGPFSRAACAIIEAMPAVLCNPLGAARTEFWVIAEALMRYDLALLPPDFDGRVVLHNYLADFAFTFDNARFTRRFFAVGGERRRPGIQTQQLPLALSCMARWGLRPSVCMFPFAPGDRHWRAVLEIPAVAQWRERCLFCADVTGWPVDVQQILCTDAEDAIPAQGVLLLPETQQVAQSPIS